MPSKTTDYKSLRRELDEIVDSLQSGALDFEAASKAYERGMTVVKELETYLKTAENKIVKLKQSFDK